MKTKKTITSPPSREPPPPPRADSAHPAAEASSYSRLHITPLDPDLLKVIVPPAILPHARFISYHTIQTFPERPYGFIELPSADANKIKKKLNGAVLRGTKIRVELARPYNMPQPSPDAMVDSSSKKSKTEKKDKKERKRKRDPQEIAGIELEEGRKVKRGWTVTPGEALAKKEKERKEEKRLAKSKGKEKKEKKDKKNKKKEPESLYSEVPECLVKTQLPPNRVNVVGQAAKDHKKSKKNKARDIVVHEFERNTKFPTFLKPTAASSTSTKEAKEEAHFVEGRGWVGDDGTVVEEVKSTRPKAFPKIQVNQPRTPRPMETAQEDDTSSSSSGTDDIGSDSPSEDESLPEPLTIEQMSTRREANMPLSFQSPPAAPPAAAGPDQARPESSGSLRSLTIKIPSAPQTPGSTKVHPLEALYKRQKGDQTATNKDDAEPFSFFGAHGGDIDDSDDDLGGEGSTLSTDHVAVDRLVVPSQGPQVPMTPFTKQDFEWRNIRSAAPTPDTAHPSRISRFWPLKGDEENALDDVQEDTREEDGKNEDAAGRPSGVSVSEEAVEGPTNPNTDFQKWFWEHRGDLNRSWKKRRKLAAKEKRYRDNKARADRAI